jgi:enterochelin esterase-like enzyme
MSCRQSRKRMAQLPLLGLLLLAWLATAATSHAQAPSEAGALAKGTLERIEVHGPSLEGNLEGDDPTREVFVYLPPSYSQGPARRYPVVFFLHGYVSHAETYVRTLALPGSADAAFANGATEMIIVLPDAYTVYGGSLYSSSPTTGDWETFISRDLVAYIDSHYRTIPLRSSRGLAGHSMGGYGTMRIAMKHPEPFSALYAMSSCCLLIDPHDPLPPSMPDALKSQAAAWAPNPQNPPSYFDLPIEDGELQPLIYAKWLANAPLVMVDQYVPSLERYTAIALDVGDADPLRDDNVALDAALTRLGIEHSFEQYEGNHTNRVGERFESLVLPFFSKQLEAPTSRHD